MQTSSAKTKANPQDLVITRIFDAPRELVWQAWTEPEPVKRWWGPRNFTSPVVKIDLRVGGKYLNCMRSPEGKDYWSTGTYKEIVPAERLVVTDSFSDEKGNIVPASYYGMSGDFPLETAVAVTFETFDGRQTRLTLRYPGIPTENLADAESGWQQSFDKLADYLSERLVISAPPGQLDLRITRVFNAPRTLVFKAFVDPELYVQWLGPRRIKMVLEKFEPRSGGSWRYSHVDENGNKYGFHGVYHEVLEPSRLIDTFEYEGLPESGHVSLETARFEELPGGKTRLAILDVFQTVADRDGMLQSGMEEGLSEGFERLDELLEKMKSAK